ncbi:Phospholipid phosphatase 3 [Sarcoptes scabiei]|uniref:Lipid phosphate phosphatase-related protein type 1 n=1 Tax=Sarcoptes scabiei TaxID=52283 RepID=A0A834RBF7_SARSC|nr:Phospholipid phosphatase 3 [Sarcoptes scabiei]
MGSKSSKFTGIRNDLISCNDYQKENDDNNNLMKLDSISTVSMGCNELKENKSNAFDRFDCDRNGKQSFHYPHLDHHHCHRNCYQNRQQHTPTQSRNDHRQQSNINRMFSIPNDDDGGGKRSSSSTSSTTIVCFADGHCINKNTKQSSGTFVCCEGCDDGVGLINNCCCHLQHRNKPKDPNNNPSNLSNDQNHSLNKSTDNHHQHSNQNKISGKKIDPSNNSNNNNNNNNNNNCTKSSNKSEILKMTQNFEMFEPNRYRQTSSMARFSNLNGIDGNGSGGGGGSILNKSFEKIDQENRINSLTSSSKPSLQRRSSCYLVWVFLIDLLFLVPLFALAIVLQFTNEFRLALMPKEFVCRNPTDYSLPETIDSSDPWNHDLYYWLIVFFGPIVSIMIAETGKILIQKCQNRDLLPRVTIPKLKITVSMFSRRLFRITCGFILGFLALVIVINVLKLQVGRYRPYLLSICPDFCSNNSNCTEDLGNKMIEARKSFPSLTSSLSTYAALFMILYLAAAINHRAGRMIRTIMSVCLVIGSLSISINRVLAFKSHLSDVIVGIIIGSLFAIYIVFIHLNSFANILSKTNPFSSRKRWTIKKILGYDDSDDDNNNDGDDNDKIDHHQYNRNLISEEIKFWNQFRIPRVRTDFVSTLNRKPEIMTLDRNGDYRSRFNYNLPLSSRPSSVQNPLNAYVNPAFDDQSESNFGKKSSTHSFSQKPSASRLRSFN